MFHVSRRPILLLAAALVASVVPIAMQAPADAHSVCPAPVVTGDQPGLYGSPHSHAFDGDENSSFYSSHDNWQYVRIDFGCVGTFSGLSRKMGFPAGFGRGIGISFNGQRQRQGEAVAYSVDGQTWDDVTHANSTGWENNGPYATRAWHSVNYGWSEVLSLNSPAQARYVLYRWDGDGDLLFELDIDLAVDQAPPLRLSLDCLPREPLCTVTAFGGHPGSYTFNWTTTGIFGASQTNRPSSSTMAGTCWQGNQFSMGVSVTDSHGRTASAGRTDRCATIRL